MTTRPGPDWLARFQASFGAAIRAPLDRSTGTLRATPEAYPTDLDVRDAANASAAARLGVYQRQYWFRLFSVMHEAFPLTTRVLGHWRANELAERFLLESPPRHWDLDRAPDGFDAWLAGALPDDGVEVDPDGRRAPRDAIVEAATLDAAFRQVFGAPAVVPFHPSAADAARLATARLVPSPAVRVLRERWPWVASRATWIAEASERAIELPAPHPAPRWWAIVRRDDALAALPLAPREGELLTLLRAHTLEHALAQLGAACAPDERAALPAHVQAWLARSVQLGFWSGLDAQQGSMQL
jgi:hypothetical protein